jgi:hypothetical protein
MSITTDLHAVALSWVDTDGSTGYEHFASRDGEIYFSFGHDALEDITPADVILKEDGDGNFKPMGYHRNFFKWVLNGNMAVHVDYHDPAPGSQQEER